MQRLPLPGCNAIGQSPSSKPGQPPSSDFALRDILERWAGSDDTLRVVMIAKAEEDRLKQEVMRLEIRRMEMEMLKDALRASIPPHLVPQIFSNHAASTLTASMYSQPPAPVPASPGHMSQPSRLTAQHMSPYKPVQRESSISQQQQSLQSPRYLPKLETSVLSAPSAPQSAPISDHHRSQSVQIPLSSSHAESQQGATPNEQPPSALFFHHWQPPTGQAQQNPAPGDQTGGRMIPADNQPGSPTPRKRKLMQSSAMGSAGAVPSSRRSPSRGHARHRSDASALHARFSEAQQMPQPSGGPLSHTRPANERNTPSPRSQPASLETELGKKRKRNGSEADKSQQALAQTRRSLAPSASIAEEEDGRGDGQGSFR